MRPKYIFLTLSLIELTIGLSNARQNTFFYLGLPVGAILFGLFLVFQVLEKESALYDEQQRAPESLRATANARKPRRLSAQQEVADEPVLTAAHSP